MPRGNNWAIHNATKKATQNHDRPKLDYIENYLMNDNHGVKVSKSNHRFDNPNFLNKPKNHESDLILNDKGHLQHDTVKTHGELGFEDEKTQQRNAGYYRAGLPLSVINQDLAKSLGLDEGPLTVYLYYHSLMLKNAREYNG